MQATLPLLEHARCIVAENGMNQVSAGAVNWLDAASGCAVWASGMGGNAPPGGSARFKRRGRTS